MAAAISSAPNSSQIAAATQNQLTRSFNSAVSIAEQYPQYSQQIVAAAKASFLRGEGWAYLAGIVAILLGAALVFFAFPQRDDERRLLSSYQESE
jgi:hypothetical protein